MDDEALSQNGNMVGHQSKNGCYFITLKETVNNQSIGSRGRLRVGKVKVLAPY